MNDGTKPQKSVSPSGEDCSAFLELRPLPRSGLRTFTPNVTHVGVSQDDSMHRPIMCWADMLPLGGDQVVEYFERGD